MDSTQAIVICDGRHEKRFEMFIKEIKSKITYTPSKTCINVCVEFSGNSRAWTIPDDILSEDNITMNNYFISNIGISTKIKKVLNYTISKE